MTAIMNENAINHKEMFPVNMNGTNTVRIRVAINTKKGAMIESASASAGLMVMCAVSIWR